MISTKTIAILLQNKLGKRRKEWLKFFFNIYHPLEHAMFSCHIMILSAFALGDLSLPWQKRISNRERSDGLRFVTSWFMKNSVSLQGIHLRLWQKLMIAFEVETQRKQTAATKRLLRLLSICFALFIYLFTCLIALHFILLYSKTGVGLKNYEDQQIQNIMLILNQGHVDFLKPCDSPNLTYTVMCLQFGRGVKDWLDSLVVAYGHFL